MTQILPEKFLDYSDILIKPKMGNNLNSRSDVNLIREFTFKRGQVRKGIPVFNANMSTVGNFATAKALLAAGMFATIHKFYTADEIIDFIKECNKEGISTENLFVSIGIKNLGEEFYKLKKLSEMPYGFPASPNICIDAPNFYIPNAMYVLQECRHLYPDAVIMCGNVASSDICQMLFKYADIIKIGIGSGCFVGETEILTNTGIKKIKDIACGDMVLTHKGQYKPVINKFEYNHHKRFININGIECTPEHEFFVVNKDEVFENIEEEYISKGYFIKASELDENKHLLVQIEL